MKSTKLLTLCALVAIVMSSCHKTNPYNTSHPDHGKIEFIADWSNLEEGIGKPEKYTIYVEGETSTISANEKIFPTLIEPGKHSILIYSTTEKIKLDPENSTAGVDVNDNMINGNIGRLYTLLLEDVLIEADKVIKIERKMEPQVRKLVIILKVKDISSSNVEIDDKTASLTGVASEWNYETNTAVSEAKVRPEFKVYNEEEFRASIELLGVVPGSVQNLSFGLIYRNHSGEKEMVKISADLTEAMKSFNNDKNTPLVLKCNILEIGGEIGEWEVGEVENGSHVVIPWPD